MKQVETEINRLSNISHPNLLRVLAVKLSLSQGNGAGPARLVILSEERPSLSLEDVLEDCECLRENKAKVRFTEELTLSADATISWIGLSCSMLVGFTCNSCRRSCAQRLLSLWNISCQLDLK